MEEVMTIKDVLKVTIKLLESIRIPVALSEEVGIPIAKSIMNLNVCVNVMNEAEKKAEAKEKEDGREVDAE